MNEGGDGGFPDIAISPGPARPGTHKNRARGHEQRDHDEDGDERAPTRQSERRRRAEISMGSNLFQGRPGGTLPCARVDLESYVASLLDDVANFLEGVMPLIRQERAMTAFFAVRFGPSKFGIFNTFPDDAGRYAHVTGHAAETLFGRADELLASPPTIEPVDIVAAKLPVAVA